MSDHAGTSTKMERNNNNKHTQTKKKKKKTKTIGGVEKQAQQQTEVHEQTLL
jgi:hypothetical protein